MVATEGQVLRVAGRLLGDRELARDAAQEVFLRVFKYLRGFREREDFRAWLYRITVNVCRDAGRRTSRPGPRVSLEGREPEDGGIGDGGVSSLTRTRRRRAERSRGALPARAIRPRAPRSRGAHERRGLEGPRLAAGNGAGAGRERAREAPGAPRPVLRERGEDVTCRAARRLLPLFAGGDLKAPEMSAVAGHVAACPACRAEVEAFAAARSLLPLASLSFGESERALIRRRVLDEIASRGNPSPVVAFLLRPRFALAALAGVVVLAASLVSPYFIRRRRGARGDRARTATGRLLSQTPVARREPRCRGGASRTDRRDRERPRDPRSEGVPAARAPFEEVGIRPCASRSRPGT